MSETDLAVVSPSIAVARRGQFAPEQVELIRATVAKDLDTPELALFLETCVRHDLDPFIKEVWGYKIKGRAITVVSRDGLLKIANRCTGPRWAEKPGEFLGCMSGVVHADDHFDFHVEVREDGTERWAVDHRPRTAEDKPTFGGKDGTGRGEIVGSFARVRRRGHDDVLFVAHRHEYDKGDNVWRSHPHAMMQKVAEAMALRKAFSIAGVVGEGETERSQSVLSEPASGVQGTEEFHWPEDPELRQALEDGFRALGYKRAKVRALVNGCETREDFEALLAKLHAEADTSEEPAITDAEVVDDDPGPEQPAEPAEVA